MFPSNPFPGPVAVTAAEMRAIEGWMFAGGLPVESLMEKVVGRITDRLLTLYPLTHFPRVGVLVGAGHNGGDAVSVARELFLQGYRVNCVAVGNRFKPLTQSHINYAQTLGIPWFQSTEASDVCGHLEQIYPAVQWWIDGLLGFGLERPVMGALAQVIEWINNHPAPVVSLDLPSGLESDRGVPLGTAIRATHTLCLGLWKRGLWEESSLAYTGTQTCLDIGIPSAAIKTVFQDYSFGTPPQALTKSAIEPGLSWFLSPTSHKYQRGHLLIIAGSRHYRGAAILAALGARSSGAGLVSIAVPAGLAEQVSSAVPEAIVIPCPEWEDGSIERLPLEMFGNSGAENFGVGKPGPYGNRFQCVLCGPGLTLGAAQRILPQLLDPLAPVVVEDFHARCPLLLDADALNALGSLGLSYLGLRQAPTLLAPDGGEFRRLFPALAATESLSRLEQAQQAAQRLAALGSDSPSRSAIVILKGARTVIAPSHPLAVPTWVNIHSTPALARAGSGDVLAGLMGGLLATQFASEGTVTRPPRGLAEVGSFLSPLEASLASALDAAKAAVYWHSQAGLWAEQRYTSLGVDAWHLAESLSPALASL